MNLPRLVQELGRGDLNWIHVRIFTKIAGLNPLKRKLVK